jgi:hypothetical protein
VTDRDLLRGPLKRARVFEQRGEVHGERKRHPAGAAGRRTVARSSVGKWAHTPVRVTRCLPKTLARNRCDKQWVRASPFSTFREQKSTWNASTFRVMLPQKATKAKPASCRTLFTCRYYLIMETRRTKTLSTEPLKTYPLTLTPTAKHFFHQLSREASDALGRKVSNSAMLRALLAYVEQQPRSWASKHLYPFVEQEMARGRVWGRTKRE